MKKKSRDVKRALDGEISPEDQLRERRDGAAASGAGVARKVAHLTPGSVSLGERRRVTRFHGPAMAVGSRLSTDPTRSGCSRSRR